MTTLTSKRQKSTRNFRKSVTKKKSPGNINPNSYGKLGKNFVNFITNKYTCLTETKKKANVDIGVSSTSSTFNEKSEIGNEIVDHITSADLKSLHVRNFNKIIVGHLNINSIRNKFDFLAHQLKENIDILMISKTKLDEISLPPANFFWTATVSLFILVRMEIAVVFCCTLETIYHPKFYQ